jgi:fused signal recognition particle receptor
MSDTAPKSWREKLFGGLKRTSEKLGENLGVLFAKPLDAQTLDEIEEALIVSDLGPAMAMRIRDRLEDTRHSRPITEEYVREVIAEEVEKVLKPVAKPLEFKPMKPHVILVIGVNGSGKTTTIAKLAKRFQEQGRSVMLAAGDTFRAAAIGQLKIWAERIGVPIVSGKEGGDAAGLAFSAVQQAIEQGIDILIVDTAGRLQNRTELMDELAKIRRVLGRLDPASPHDVVLVLDATSGNNVLSQIEVFRDVAQVTGLVMTKLDGTARGGMLVAAAEKYGLPIHAIGVGETIDDLRPFDPADMAKAIAGSAYA